MLFKLGFGTGSGVTRGQIIYKALGVSFFFSRRSLRPPCTEWARSSIAGRPYEDPWGGWGLAPLLSPASRAPLTPAAQKPVLCGGVTRTVRRLF